MELDGNCTLFLIVWPVVLALWARAVVGPGAAVAPFGAAGVGAQPVALAGISRSVVEGKF